MSSVYLQSKHTVLQSDDVNERVVVVASTPEQICKNPLNDGNHPLDSLNTVYFNSKYVKRQ